MKKAIVLTVTDRPDYLQLMLLNLEIALDYVDMSDYVLYVNAEPVFTREGNLARAMIADIDYIEVDWQLNKERLGLRKNTFDVIERAFADHEHVLYLEDDIGVSPDVFALWDWYIEQDLENVGIMSLFNMWGNGNPALVLRTRSMTCWGFFITKAQYEKYARPVWMDEPHMWDNNLAKHVRTFENAYNLVPALSRTTNYGEIGTHVTPEIYKRLTSGHRHNAEIGPYKYVLDLKLSDYGHK